MSKEMSRINWNRIKTAAGVVVLCLAPFLSYILFEYVTGNIREIPMDMALLNVGWMFLFYLVVFAVSGSSRITISVSSLILYIISVAETFVVSFRGKPILITEFLSLGTALSVAGNYTFRFSKEMVFAGIAILMFSLLTWQVPVRLRGWKLRSLNAVLCSLVVFGGVNGFYNNVMPNRGLVVNLWSLADSYVENGFILSTAVSLQYMVKDAPKGYSTAALNEIYDKTTERLSERMEQIDEDAVKPVNIICIMNESLAELKVAGEYETNDEYFPFMNSLTENTVRGSLCVPVFGSLTSNTEYEFLTGDSMALLPVNSIAYQFFVKPDTQSLVSTLKDQGYQAIAMHPYPGDNWNRRTCYQNMGFDQFLDEEYYVGSEVLRNYVSDKADYEKIIELVEQKETPEDRLFVFNVTMQNHGGYDTVYENFEQEIWLTGEYEGKYPKTDQYLSLMKASDEAFEYLLDYFESSEEPTMIVIFGDHQPGVEDEFYDDIGEIPSADVVWEDRLVWYQTPFIIWTNYEQPTKDMGKLSTVFLASHMLELANLELTPYDEFLLGLSVEVPVVHFLGCYDSNDVYHYWNDASAGSYAYSDALKAYEMLVYNHSLDNKEMQKLFRIPNQYTGSR